MTIATVTDAKTHLNIAVTDMSQDSELQRFIDAATVVVENIIGPVNTVTYTETYDGGLPYISLRHTPITSITSVTEYVGSTAYVLTATSNPTQGSTYSFGFDASTGRIVRRTSGGGMTNFAPGDDSVQVVYVAGLASVPANVRLATLELVRHWYQQTQLGGRPNFGSSAIDESYTPSDGFAIPNRVRELLAPQRRAPAVA